MKTRQDRGFALIEALVSLALFSIGIVGLCGAIQLASRQNSQTRYRTIAQYYADEIIGVATVDSANASCYTIPKTTCTGGTGQAIAADWLGRASGALPAGDPTRPVSGRSPTVSYDATTGNLTVTLQWQVVGDAAGTWHNLVSITNLN